MNSTNENQRYEMHILLHVLERHQKENTFFISKKIKKFSITGISKLLYIFLIVPYSD